MPDAKYEISAIYALVKTRLKDVDSLKRNVEYVSGDYVP